MTEQRSRQQVQRSDPLHTDRGSTTIQDSVVSKIAGTAAQEVGGVQMGGGASRAVGGLLENVTGGGSSSQTRGVTVEVGDVECAVDLSLSAEYGVPIPRLSETIRRNVINRIENLVGLRVTEVNITVNDVYFPQEGQQTGGQSQS